MYTYCISSVGMQRNLCFLFIYLLQYQKIERLKYQLFKQNNHIFYISLSVYTFKKEHVILY